MRVEREVQLTVPPEEAWRILTHWEDQARWMRDADSVRVLTPHRAGVGVELAVRTRVFNVPAFTERLEVAVWEPPFRLVVAHRSFARGIGVWRLRADGGGTRFAWAEALWLPVPLLGEPVLQAYRPVMWWLMGRAMADLAAFVAGQRSAET